MKEKRISIPGSKSYTNRALIMAALTDGLVEIKNPLISDDTEAMIHCLETLGIKIEKQYNNIIVPGTVRDAENKKYVLDVNISGTTMRFITALAVLTPGTKTIFGKEGLNKRPIGELIEGLRKLGANIEYVDKEGFPPIEVYPSQIQSTITSLHGDVSSQYFTALLMIAPLLPSLTIKVIGNQISKSYIDMTIGMMEDWGVQVDNNNYHTYRVSPGQKYSMSSYTVEGDYSGAGYFFALAALTNSTITLENLNPHSKQGDAQFLDILEQMGNEIHHGKNEITIVGKGISPVEVDMELCPDQAQTLAVLAAFADGTTKISGVRSLRVKETERVVAIQNELAKMGVKTEATHDTLTIYGGSPHAAIIDTYGDHRMAMSFALAKVKLKDMKINNPEVVNKTFPTFWEKMKSLGIEL